MKQMTEKITVLDHGVRLVGILKLAAEKPGPLVIVLHGFTSAKDRPHTIAACEAMREAGFAPLRFDLYGHGESGGEFRKHTLDKWVSNTLAMIDYAAGLDFVTEIWLSGHSQGGLTAALAAGKEPERVKGLILRAPAFMIPRCAREGNMLGVRFDPARIPEAFPTIKGLTLEAGYIRSAQAIHVEEAIDAFPGPVLLLHGEADDVVPLRDVAAAAERYRNCRLELIPRETHHFDQAPERMKTLIRSWLEQQKPFAMTVKKERQMRKYKDPDYRPEEFERLRETRLTAQDIFHGQILHLRKDTVRLPNGGTAPRELIVHVGAVCIVPVTEDGQVYVERQFRYPLGQVITEIPAGKLDSNTEDILEAAKRELREETGLTAERWTELGLYYPAAAYSDEVITMYLAQGLHRGAQELDADEFLDVELLPLEQLIRDIMDGKVPDGKTQVAVLKAARMLGR